MPIGGLNVAAHRGAMGVEPENTLRSFRRAVADGADEVELDLRLTRDGHLVVLHDTTVDRTTDGSGAICDLTFAEARTLDAGLGERIPTFDEVAEAVDIAIQAQVEVPEATDLVLAAIDRHDLLGRVIVTSFQPAILETVARTRPDVRRGLISNGCPPDTPSRAKAVGASTVYVGVDALSVEVVADCRKAGIDVWAWPVNDVDTVKRVQAAGIQGFTTDYPGLRAVFA